MILVHMALYFCLLSVVAIGGLPAVMPEMQRYVVDVKGWLSAEEFMQMFAIGQAAPGPNFLIACLIGWKIAGLAGAFVALGAMTAPAAVLVWYAVELWDRLKDSPWRRVIQRAISPLVIGMILSSGYILATPAYPQWELWLIAAATATGLVFTRVNPLWFIILGGALGGFLL